MTWFVRVANKGLNVPVFSMGCAVSVRVAGKGLREARRRAEGAKPGRKVRGAGENSAGEAKIISKSSIRLSNCQAILFTGTRFETSTFEWRRKECETQRHRGRREEEKFGRKRNHKVKKSLLLRAMLRSVKKS